MTPPAGPDTELQDRIALVTGGARNVGKAIARRLAASGALVVINHWRSPEAARQTQAEIEAAGGRAHVIRASVASRAQVDRMFDAIEAEFGGLDILVNNAANGALVPNDEVTETALDRALDTNLKGSLSCAMRAAPLMAGRGGGSIVNLSTVGGGQLVMASYLACGPAKAAVEALTRYLAVDLARYGIRVNTAAAGILESEVADLFPQAEAMQRTAVQATPFGRLGRPEELAELVAFLASPRSSWITGQLVLADGGLSTGAALLTPLPLEHPVTSADRDATRRLPAPRTAPDPVAAAPAEDRATSAAVAVPRARTAASPQPQEVIDDEIAVVGMGIAVSGANDPAEYWRLLVDGDDRFEAVPADRWDNDRFFAPNRREEDKTYSDRSAFITGFTPHRALAAELEAPPTVAPAYESTTLWLRHALLQALDGVHRRPEDRCAFLVGYTADGSQHLEEATVRLGALSRLDDVLAGLDLPADPGEVSARIDEALGRRYPRSGPDPLRFLPHLVAGTAMAGVLPAGTEVLVVDTACSSSLYAVDLGLKGLLDGRHDVAVCGGAFSLGPRGSILFAKLNGLSARGEVRCLDKDSDGVLFSDGAATVVLKRLSRARADGDRVLATLKAFGSSSDGKGKAIYAPSAAGQKLAIRRAMAHVDAGTETPEWIVAHATGTPAGDLAEFTTLRESVQPGARVQVTSNKSVIGHTGWAAGVASLIEVVLGLQHEEIPPQHRFVAAPTAFELDTTSLTIPTASVPWPRRTDRRVASVSGFGFGGTNAHLVVQDAPDPAAPVREPGPRPAPAQQRIAVVASAAHLPDAVTVGQAVAGGDAHATSFGELYPLPPFARVRMPPGTMRSIDRCQLMVLECAHLLRERLGSFWEEQRDTTGVVLGHLGATRNATLYATRCYLDDLTAALSADPALSGEPWLPAALQRLAAETKRLVPPSNEDSFPGMMPNVIPARVANYFDLHGLNMTVDTGFTSTLSAIDVASRYLRRGELSMALVGGINGNTTPEVRRLLTAALDRDAVLAEGAFLFALVTEETARAAGLDVLAFLEAPTTAAVPGDGAEPTGAVIGCGARAETRSTCFLGAEGAVGLAAALEQAAAGVGSTVRCHGGPGAADLTVRVSPPESTATPPAVPARFYDPHTVDGTTGTRVARHVPYLRPDAGAPAGTPQPFWPAEPTVLLTDQPALLTDVDVPPHVLTISTARAEATSPRVVHVGEPDPDAVRTVLEQADPHGRIAHVRLLTSLAGTAEHPTSGTESLVALHDLLFLVLQERSRPDRSVASCVALFLDAYEDGAPRPLAGLFTGLVKVLHLEAPSALTVAVMTDHTTAAAGVATAERETALTRQLPVVHYRGGERLTVGLRPEPGELLPADAGRLGPESVVVAVGGGRGIAAELLTELAGTFRCRIVVLGSNDLDAHPRRYLDMSDAEFAGSRREFILEQRSLHPTRTPGQLNRAYQRVAEARATRHNLRRMAEHSGQERVSYVRCDATDRAQVADAIASVLATTGGIDLLLNVAGVNRSAPIATKQFAEFTAVRDLKLRTYQNLKAALRGSPPRTWCNFGSLLGMTGQVGEADYASGNDFLAAAAVFASRVHGTHETTIGWTLWADVGLGADALTRSYFEKSGTYSNMGTAEGVHHFVRELQQARPAPHTIHLGAAETAAVSRLLPGLLDGRAAEPGTPTAASTAASTEPGDPARPAPPFYLGRRLESGPDRAVLERQFSLRSDRYLEHHRVNGVPTLPGTFVAEIAAEAATALVPELSVFALEDVVFRHFLKVPHEDRPLTTRLSVRVRERRPDLAQAAVEVKVLSDVVAPNGTVLVTDRVHFEATVLLAAETPPAPRWEPWPDLEETPVADPYHRPGSPVLLTGMFASTARTRLHPWGRRATYTLRLPGDDPVFSRFRLPTILLDGLARTGVLSLEENGLVPLAAPLGIRRIDVYEQGSDCDVAARYGSLDLYAVMTQGSPGGAGSTNRFAAVRPDGRLLLQMQDLRWTPLGFLRPRTGEFLSPEAARALLGHHTPVGVS